MFEEDCFIDTPEEPQVSSPKESLIDMETRSPTNILREFKDLSIVRKLNTGKFPVFLVECKDNNKNYAMKVFPLEDKMAQACFQTETKFLSLTHPNVIKIIYCEQFKTIEHEDMRQRVSFILSEFAPHGDFLKLVNLHHQSFDEMLIRTYFHQLIEGLEYLHSQKIVHLDIKLQNLLLDENFNLRIADFDLSSFTNNSKITSHGTRNHRAPEMINGKCKNGIAADIYSAGITLFNMKYGMIPHTENEPNNGIDFFYLLNNNNREFWRRHAEFQNKGQSDFCPDFKALVNGMLRLNPKERLSIAKIKESNWYNGPVYKNQELKSVMQAFV